MSALIYKQPDPEIDGWMSQEELQWLYSAAKLMMTIVEVGSWKGRSTHALCMGCPGRVTAVDHFQGSQSELDTFQKEARVSNIYEIFRQNLARFDNLSTLRMSSLEASGLFIGRSVDMVFLDGEHTLEAVRTDIRLWLPVARYLICGHDFDRWQIQSAVGDAGIANVNVIGTIWYAFLEGFDAKDAIHA